MSRFFLHTALFVVVLALVFFVAYMIHYSLIQKEVRNRSRCYKAKLQFSAGGEYDVKAVDEQGTEMYKLTYNTAKKQVKHECACPKGDVVNHFKDVKYYDLKTASERSIKDLMCNCDMAYDTIGADVFYEGHPGLVRYMQNADASFFTTDLSGSIAARTDLLPPKEAAASITVNAAKGEKPLYRVAYNVSTLSTDASLLDNDPFKINCTCPNGTVNNEFKIRVYDKNRKTVEKKQVCPCNADYVTTKDGDAPVSYTGSQGLVDFMNDSSKVGVFDAMKRINPST